MLLKEIATKLNLNLESKADETADVTLGYSSDLLSDVLAKAKDGALWITNQKHQNIVGVAVMLNLAGVIIAGGLKPEDNTLEKANDEGIPLYTTDKQMFEVVGRLWEMGIRNC
jgi:hypothetical protein